MLYLPAFFSLLSLALAQVLIGDLRERKHDVSGTLYAIDTRTLRIENFVYDGEGPEAVFWLNNGSEPSTAGRVIPFKDSCKEPTKLPKYSGETVELELPPDLTIADMGYFSVWCIRLKTEFGGIAINQTKLEDVPPLETASCPTKLQGVAAGVFPVKRGWNCEPLSGDYQVRWRLDVNKTKIDIELVARLQNEDSWMGFGPSGSDQGTQMLGSDVTVVYRQGTEFFAFDYYMDKQQPCQASGGVCPDTNLNSTHGIDDVTNVSGAFQGDLTLVRYTRPVKVRDTTLDKDIVTEGSAFVSWAVGPLQDRTLFPLKHIEPLSAPTGPVSIEFGREPKDSCTDRFEIPAEEPSDIPGFERPILYNVTNITARIGPSGGVRGVSTIIEGRSKEIAWYLSETGPAGKDILIPALGVERGKTYTFNVFGGIPEDENDTTVHPFYITSSSVGGYEQFGPRQRAREKVYAGIGRIEKNNQGGVISYQATAAGELCRLATNVSDTSKIETYEEFYNDLNRSCVADQTITENGGKLVWKVAKDTPDLVYYQSVTHETLGYKIRVFDFGKVDIAELRKASGGGPLNAERDAESCAADFKGESRQFSGCAKGLRGNVDVFWNINQTSKEIETLFRAPKGPSAGYVGVGWGYDEMVGSNAVIAFEAEGGSQIADYMLEGRKLDGSEVQPNNKQKLISSDSDSSGEFLTGIFTRRLEVNGLPSMEIGTTKLIWAIGPRPSSPKSLTIHSVKGSGTVDLAVDGQKEQTVEDESGGLGTVFVIHGVFMGISWLVLIPIAIIAMRFFKKYNPITFNVHRGINGTAAALTVAAFIMAIVSGSRTETAHLVIGIIVFSLVVLQVLGGVFRPRKATPIRKPWYWLHALSGSVASGLGIANCFLGIGTERIGGPVGWYVVAGVVTGLLVLVQIIFSFMPNKFPTTEGEAEGNRTSAIGESMGRTFVRDD